VKKPTTILPQTISTGPPSTIPKQWSVRQPERRDDREGDREVGESAHSPVKFLRVAQLMKLGYVHIDPTQPTNRAFIDRHRDPLCVDG
jgi:hypothetical protein